MKTALVTGASRGIGAAIARELAQEGFCVAVNYRHSEEAAKRLAAELHGIAIQADVSDAGQVAAMAETVKRELGDIDLLVNNAGIAQQKLFSDITEADWDRMFGVNIKGMYLTCREFLPGMVRRHSGSIINLSSIWGIAGASCETHYSASKAAVIGFTKALAKEVGPSNIRVNCIAPGVIMTDMNAALGGDTLDALKEETPLGILGKPEDIAHTVAFLASEKARFLTGQVIGVNGGIVI